MATPAPGWEDHGGARMLLDPAALTRSLEPGWRTSTAWPVAPVTVAYVRFGSEQAWVSYCQDDDAAAGAPVGYASCVRGATTPPAAPGATILEVGSSRLAVHRWPEDAALPALRDALLGREISDALGAAGRPVAVEVIHYKPERRAVLRARHGDRTAYVRIPVGGSAADLEVPLLEHLHRWMDGDPGVQLPQVLACPWGNGGVIISEVRGVSLTSLFGTPTERSVGRSVGRALARFHAVPVPGLGLDLPSVDRGAMVHATAEDLGLLGRLAPALEDLADDVRRLLLTAAAAPQVAGVLLHGGMHPGNVLIDGDVVGIIDLDGAAVGEPEADLGKLLAGISIHGRTSESDLGGEVLAAYELEAGHPVGRDALDVWMAGVLVTRAMRDFKRGDDVRQQRSEQLLSAAARCLDAASRRRGRDYAVTE